VRLLCSRRPYQNWEVDWRSRSGRTGLLHLEREMSIAQRVIAVLLVFSIAHGRIGAGSRSLICCMLDVDQTSILYEPFNLRRLGK